MLIRTCGAKMSSNLKQNLTEKGLTSDGSHLESNSHSPPIPKDRAWLRPRGNVCTKHKGSYCFIVYFSKETRFQTVASGLVGETSQGEHLWRPQAVAGFQTHLGMSLYLLESRSGQQRFQHTSERPGGPWYWAPGWERQGDPL